MIIELLVIIIVSNLFKNKAKGKIKRIKYYDNLIEKQTINNNVVYLMFIGLTVIVTILNPSILKSISILQFEGRLESHSIIDKSINQVLLYLKYCYFL